MAKDINTILKEFQTELIVNDKKVQNEINTKSKDDLSKEFVKFVKENQCKIKMDKKAGKCKVLI